MNLHTSTIAAISTPPGKGGVAVIRISGNDALAVSEKIFFPRGKNGLKNFPRKQIYGDIYFNGERIDDGLATYFPSPNSYTGEDTVEIACHGGILISSLVLEAALSAGAVPAIAGEFTKRAFLSGKISLTDAEATGLLLDAKSMGQVKLSSVTSRNRLNEKVEGIRQSLINLMGSIYARIDYPDEDLGDFSDEEILSKLSSVESEICELSKTYRIGKSIAEGISTTLCGRPNTGKSTLYNLISGDDLAIVTNIPGTTRDVLETTVSLGNLLLRISDTAGIRNSIDADTVEAIGIERSKDRIKNAELIIALFDASSELCAEDYELIDFISSSKGCKVALMTKCDIENKEFSQKTENYLKNAFERVLKIYAKTEKEKTLFDIKDTLCELFLDEKILVGEDAIISSARQNAILKRAREHITASKEALSLGFFQDAASSDIELAIGALSELDGRCVSEEIVSDIFSRFCVGK